LLTALRDREKVYLEEWLGPLQWGCGLCSDPWSTGCLAIMSLLAWCYAFPGLSYLVLQRMLLLAKTQVHRALAHPLTSSIFSLAVSSVSKLRWPAKLERKMD
jgi:hypothetical protein